MGAIKLDLKKDKPHLTAEQLLQFSFDATKDGISILDKDLRILRVNKVMEKWYSHAMPLVGKKCHEAYQSDRRPCRICPSQRALQSGEQATIVVPYSGEIEQIGWLELTAYPIKDDQGLALGVLELVHDISLDVEHEKEAAETTQRVVRQRGALSKLFAEPALNSGNLKEAARVLTEIAAATVQVERTSLWLLEDDKQELRCVDLYELSKRRHSSGMVLKAGDYPNYFAAIRQESRVYVDDAYSDKRTLDFVESYLDPLDIRSMLDAGIFAGGQLKGVFSFEQVGTIRRWHADDESFAGTVAAIAAQVIETDYRKRAEREKLESEQKYKSLFRHSADPILIMQRAFVECNEEACRFYGYERGEIIGRFPAFFSPHLQPDGQKSAVAANKYISAALKGVPQTFYWQHQNRSGELLDTEVRLRRADIGREKFLIASVRDIGERIKATEIIKQNRDWYRALAEDIPVLVSRISSEGKVAYVNEAWRMLFGRPENEIIGSDFYDLVPLEYREEVKSKFNALTPEDPLVVYEKNFRGRLLRWKNRAVFNPDRTIKEFFTVGEDITEQRRSEELAQFQLQFERLVADISSYFVNVSLEKIDEAINYALKLSGEFFEADRSYLMRFSTDQQYITNPYEWCAEGVFSVQERNQALPVSNTPWWTEQILTKDYLYIPDVDTLPPEAEVDQKDFQVEGIKSLVTLPILKQDRVCAFFGFDAVKKKKHWTEQQIKLMKILAGLITEFLAKAEAQEALRESEERYREILSTIEEGYYEADLKGVLTFCNEAAGRLFGGYSPEELIGMSYHKLYKNHELAYKTFNRVFITGKPEKGLILEMIKKDGSSAFGEISITLTRDKEGFITGFKGIGKDVTERAEYEKRLEYLSLYDQLTGIHNRAYFEAELRRLEGSREYPITIISADLDGLKLINDTLGHNEGDRLLCNCATLLREALRQSDLLARVGGDEFSAILHRTGRATGEKIVQRIREKVVEYNQGADGLPLGISIGLATAQKPVDALNDVYKRADDSMYRDKLYRSSSSRGKIVQSLLAALAERDYITEGHARRLEELCRKVGEKISLSSHRLADLALLAQVHDLGKVGIPDRILYKPGRLNNKEWEVMRGHSEKGYRIASTSPDLAGVADLILKHHERWDGSGYPLGLKETEIPVECRILAIVDAFDAMTTKRPYNEKITVPKAVEELKRCSGSQFDPDLVTIFLDIIGHN